LFLSLLSPTVSLTFFFFYFFFFQSKSYKKHHEQRVPDAGDRKGREEGLRLPPVSFFLSFFFLRKRETTLSLRLFFSSSSAHALSLFFFLPPSNLSSYGPLGEVLPYLLRRALENSQMLSGGGGGGEEVEKGSRSENGSGKAAKQPLSELDAVRKELKARAVGVFLPRDK